MMAQMTEATKVGRLENLIEGAKVERLELTTEQNLVRQKGFAKVEH